MYRLTLVTIITCTKKFTAPSITILYAQYIGTFTKPYIWYHNFKRIQQIINPNVRSLCTKVQTITDSNIR